MRSWKKRVPQDEDASLTMDPMVAYGVWAARRAKDDEATRSAAILLLLLGVPALLVIAGVLALLLS